MTFRHEIENIKDDRADFGNLTNETLTSKQCLGSGALFCLAAGRATRFRGPSLGSVSGFAHFNEAPLLYHIAA